MAKSADPRTTTFSWLTPLRVVVFGTVVVGLLLTLPIYTQMPGDHEEGSCGSALKMDFGYTREHDPYYWDRTHQVCTGHRITRVTYAVGVLAVTMLMGVAMRARAQRRSSPAEEAG